MDARGFSCAVSGLLTASPLVSSAFGRTREKKPLVPRVGLTLTDHEADLFQAYWLIVSRHFCFLKVLSLMRYNLSIFFGFGSRITTFIWWICTGKNSLHSSYFVSADSLITNGRNQKFVYLLLISSSSRPNLLCFGFDLNQSQSRIPIQKLISPGLFNTVIS